MEYKKLINNQKKNKNKFWFVDKPNLTKPKMYICKKVDVTKGEIGRRANWVKD